MDSREIKRTGRSCKVFVAGIPRGVSSLSAAKFFQFYGDFYLVSPHGQRNSDLQSGVNEESSKGHCVLACSERWQADTLVNQRYFKYMGRTLTVSHHMTGTQLIIQNKMLNQCRLILKRVPGYLTEESLAKEISKKHGRVTAIFQFKNAIPQKESTKRHPFGVFSVVMENKQIADKLAAQGQIVFSDCSCALVEKYDKRVVEENKLTSNHGSPLKYWSSNFKPSFDCSKVDARPRLSNDPLPVESHESTKHFITPTSKYYASDKNLTVCFGTRTLAHTTKNIMFRVLLTGLPSNDNENIHAVKNK